jgi:hypothetical protein
MPGGPGQEPLGRTLTGPPAWSRHLTFSLTESAYGWFFYYQYRLEGVAWSCPRCHAPTGLVLRGKAVGRSTRWLRCTACSGRVGIATHPVLDLAAGLGLAPPRYFYRQPNR